MEWIMAGEAVHAITVMHLLVRTAAGDVRVRAIPTTQIATGGTRTASYTPKRALEARALELGL